MVAYVVCFDLGATVEDQLLQLNYWLSFLNSSLPLPSPSPSSSRCCSSQQKWIIFLVGLRSDLQQDSACIRSNCLDSLKKNWPRLPIFDHIFKVSSIKSLDSVNNLFGIIGKECDRIFNSHSLLIPKAFKQVLIGLQKRTEADCFAKVDEIKEEFSLQVPAHVIESALQYLHAIGRVVLFSNGLVCTNAAIAPKIVAKFVSPEEVRLQLWKQQSENVQILGKEEVGSLLDIGASANAR